MSEMRSIRDRLLESIDRWSPEVVSAPPRSTLRFGIAQKCYTQLDRLLEACVEEAVRECGEEGIQAVEVCGGGKPVSRLTLGERVQILEKLDSCLSRALEGRVPRTNAGRIIGRNGIKLLHRLSRQRNSFTHDLAEIDSGAVTELLARTSDLCESELIGTLIATQEARRAGARENRTGHEK